uniref:Uncharacterized protein n=1 Tax=Ralstonia solanacearum TaxID=305 RepID=A0A0S4WQ60_RALSL|nr:protein of unknown function [Ralstonia solanacearum]
MAARISWASSGGTRSSASIDSTHSPVARSSARFFWGPKPGQGPSSSMTLAPRARAMSRVASVLPESSTITSSASCASESMQSPMLAASLRVRMVAVSLPGISEKPWEEGAVGVADTAPRGASGGRGGRLYNTRRFDLVVAVTPARVRRCGAAAARTARAGVYRYPAGIRRAHRPAAYFSVYVFHPIADLEQPRAAQAVRAEHPRPFGA